MPIPWNEDDPRDRARIARNAKDALTHVAAHARNRDTFTWPQIQDWHRILFDGCTVPVDYYVGQVRDSDTRYPELIDYEVRVGAHRGVPSVHVSAEVLQFATRVQTAAGRLDAIIPRGARPTTAGQLQSVLELAAVAHGEIVRIHPFANGNGRTARLISNAVLLRYGLPAFLRLTPRPSATEYAAAAQDSMRRAHQPMASYLLRELNRYPGMGP